jgi:demethylmenaquinone methyltransferase/2-methoxy-6-polyprenyl-1,4-benzoquinol methylase
MTKTLRSSEPRTIEKMFSQIAKRYDLTNTVLSLGIHHLWKRKMLKFAQIQPDHRCLDAATGTGDLAFLMESQKPAMVMGIDFCEPMLAIAYQKARLTGSRVQFKVADLMDLKSAGLDEGVFDVVTVSFGIRNVADPKKAMEQLAWVLKPGGKLLVLEFGQPYAPGLRQAYQFYSKRVVPKIGGLLSKQSAAYEYLHLSAANFPCGKKFFDEYCPPEVFEQKSFQSLYGGISFLYILKKVAA